MNMKNAYMYLLGGIVVGLTFFLTYLLIYHAVPTENSQVINIAFGMLLGQGGSVVNYFFGSSKGSADKTELIKEVKQKP